MSEAITGVLKLAFGLISKKLRTYGAEKLQDGGLTDQKFRGWIVRELDDIKSKLDAISRKDLCASISFLQQGIQRLNMSCSKSSESGNSDGNPSMSELQSTVKSSTETKSPQLATVEKAVELANTIAKLKIESTERFELAKESFKEAGKEATRAFHNAALSTENRILASKVRFASGILEHLEDLEIAVSDCLQYLKELHDMPAIQEIFSVHIQGGIKSLFKKDLRAEIVENVTTINSILADFISKFTKQRMAVFDWPTIVCGKRVVHPIHFKNENLASTGEIKITPPWDIVVHEDDELRYTCAFNQKEDLICVTKGKHGPQKFVKTTGNLQPYCPSALEGNIRHPAESVENVTGLAVDEDDMVYVLGVDEDRQYRLSVYGTNGRNTHQSILNFLVRFASPIRGIAVTNKKNVVIAGIFHANPVYICNRNGELVNSFNPSEGPGPKSDRIVFMSVSSNDEIVLVTQTINDVMRNSYCLFTYTEDGKFQRTVKFRTSEGWYRDIFYNHVTKTIIGYVTDRGDKSFIEYLSGETGELQCLCLLYHKNFPESLCSFTRLACSINGTMALVSERYLIYLQKP